MKTLSETLALEKLHELKIQFADRIRAGYEHRAKDCMTCETQGACCLDAHFVNVHVTRLEAAAIKRVMDGWPIAKRNEVLRRILRVIDTYDLDTDGDTFAKTFACPLFEKGTGCLVHERGKPLPCIEHACYEKQEDLPPDEMLAQQEGLVEKLNELTYRKPVTWLPLPVAVARALTPTRSTRTD
ncbi:MAG TPA: hypothetical protein VFZ23_13835 [Pyrinomonadaceae bacterium]